jgi:hypothetical protein
MLQSLQQKLLQLAQTLLDKIQEQTWFQQLKSKYDELDAQSRTYLQWAGAGAAVLIVAWVFIGTAWKVHRIRGDLAEKDELLQLIQSANEEMGELKAKIPYSAEGGPASNQPLKDYVSGIAVNAGIAPGALELSNEKLDPPREGARDASRDTTKETLAQVSVKKINVKQVVRLLFQLENGSRPIKVRNLNIDTHTDESGYLDATLQISAFTVKSS